MVKICVLDGDRIEAAEVLLQSFAANLPAKICDGTCDDADILVVNKIPTVGASAALLTPGVIIANSDDIQVLQFVSRMGAQIITYGLNPRAAVTVSSHADDSCVICIQRAITTIHGAPILPQEFSVNIIEHKGFDTIILGAVAAALVCGMKF